MESVLIIDDEEDIRDILKYTLEKEGYIIHTARNGEKGLEMAIKHLPQLIILDVMMPEMDGIEVCERLRANPATAHIKICFLTARNEDYSQIAGFDAGGDDYVAKPVKPKVLLSRINALLRRDRVEQHQAEFSKDDLIIDRERYLVIFNGEELQFPKKEFELLSLLASRPHKVFEREIILDTVWGDGVVVGNRTIDVHIRKLREKLGDDCIQTIKGVGYKYCGV